MAVLLYYTTTYRDVAVDHITTGSTATLSFVVMAQVIVVVIVLIQWCCEREAGDEKHEGE